MVGPFKNSGIEGAFNQLNEVESKEDQCIVIGWLVKNAHDLTQDQLNHLDCLLCKPWEIKRGAPAKHNRSWHHIRLIRQKYAEDGIIPPQIEVIKMIINNDDYISEVHSARVIFNQIKNFIYYIPASIGRPKKDRKSSQN